LHAGRTLIAGPAASGGWRHALWRANSREGTMKHLRLVDLRRCGGTARLYAGSCALLTALILAPWQTISAQPAPEVSRSELDQFQARVSNYAQSIKSHAQLKKIPDKMREPLVEFISGNMFFVLLHELGHAAMQELGMPVLGREEDQADNFAIMV